MRFRVRGVSHEELIRLAETDDTLRFCAGPLEHVNPRTGQRISIGGSEDRRLEILVEDRWVAIFVFEEGELIAELPFDPRDNDDVLSHAIQNCVARLGKTLE